MQRRGERGTCQGTTAPLRWRQLAATSLGVFFSGPYAGRQEAVYRGFDTPGPLVTNPVPHDGHCLAEVGWRCSTPLQGGMTIAIEGGTPSGGVAYISLAEGQEEGRGSPSGRLSRGLRRGALLLPLFLRPPFVAEFAFDPRVARSLRRAFGDGPSGGNLRRRNGTLGT